VIWNYALAGIPFSHCGEAVSRYNQISTLQQTTLFDAVFPTKKLKMVARTHPEAGNSERRVRFRRQKILPGVCLLAKFTSARTPACNPCRDSAATVSIPGIKHLCRGNLGCPVPAS
jgi:hypothetical protein